MTWQTIIITAISLGFLGSFHCIGMCGPIALSLPVAHLEGIRKYVGILLYNIGRAVTYAIIGFIFGYIGIQMTFFGIEQKISIALGVLLLILFIVTISGKKNRKIQALQNKWNAPLINLLSKFIQKKGLTSLFVIGLLNGLLPCGLVYLAIVGSIESAMPIKGAGFMFIFGLGTIPAMLSLTVIGNMASMNIRNKIKSAMPYLSAMVGVLLIVRGLNLNIPYISPKIEAKEVSCCNTDE